FFAKLWYKAASAGRELVKVDPRGTSQVCVCGAAVPKTLAERWHECPVCGLSAPRDVVTAQVILERARIGRSRHNVEDVVSCVPREAVAFQATEVSHSDRYYRAGPVPRNPRLSAYGALRVASGRPPGLSLRRLHHGRPRPGTGVGMWRRVGRYPVLNRE